MASGRTNDEIALYVAQTITELEEYLHHLTKNGDPDDARADKISQWVESWTKYLKIDKIVRDMTAQSEYLEKLINKIKNLKMGSIALLNQVTTISKLRLLDPINKKSLLTDITLSAETLDIIDDALKNIL
ncbi:hypothetical protein [Streptococcus suis]|uniref:Uncharacterized protein n=1 Tax=Streptococcus suis TaxID=1307 RepID=A0A0Z8FDD3_STRSU|nr:hypothetical protein [Streptococcus suis]NQH31036.1 hypothetical protein [Streptococcus suis]NQH47166.1 hypothetical protein [Streptococcus suis]NQI05307.1 hypothetical protein [Streptococcus suis]CYT96393.1 Uncharacterised protein [Streptococcus suis]CYU68367.1 Uncharacterised protein [Streptococcus suis]